MFEVPELKYSYDALEPYLSEDIVHYHYDKHTKGYFKKLNELIKGTKFEDIKTLDKLITNKSLLKADTAIFNNAAQAWNHSFYWNCLAPKDEGGEPSKELKDAMSAAGGSYKKFIEAFNDGAAKHFGSGWGWMVFFKDKVNSFALHDAGNPYTEDRGIPLLTVDIWEHAYYLEYKNDRAKYLDKIWNIINWNFVNEQYNRATKEKETRKA